MESEENQEKILILKYLWRVLKGYSSLDLIVAGIFIAEDSTKMEKVGNMIKNARQLMDQHSLKREHEISLFEQMIHKLYKIQKGEKSQSSESSEEPLKELNGNGKKAEKKAKEKMEEEKKNLDKNKAFTNRNGTVKEEKLYYHKSSWDSSDKNMPLMKPIDGKLLGLEPK